MNAFYLTVVVLGVAAQNVVRKAYSNKTGGKGAFFYTSLLSLVALLFFLLINSGFKWEAGVLPYTVGFAASYAIANVASSLALNHGSLSLTSLIVSYSLMIPTFYGLIFLDEQISDGLIPGLILLAISLFLINKKTEDTKISFKWAIWAFFALVGNGMCSTTQKMQQVVYGDTYKNEFMVIALAVVFVVLGIYSFVTEKEGPKIFAKKGWWLIVIGGLANGLVNFLVMLLNSKKFPVSLMFPIISAGGIIITFFVSKWGYKENLTKTQLVGFACGVVSVILLNI